MRAQLCTLLSSIKPDNFPLLQSSGLKHYTNTQPFNHLKNPERHIQELPGQLQASSPAEAKALNKMQQQQLSQHTLPPASTHLNFDIAV
jgi:hypothetical protein